MLRPRSALFPHQKAALARLHEVDQLALLLAPGDGKTVVTMTDLLDRGAWPALVVAPASVVEAGVWEEEAGRWEHLHNLAIVPLVGTQAKRDRQLQREPPHIEVVSYENLRWLTARVPAEQRYAAIVFDELSKMKTPGTRRFKRMRGRSARIPVRRGLTGTPVPNHIADLWGELFMVAGPGPLGPTVEGFRSQYLEPVDYYERVLRLKCCADCGAWEKGHKVCHDSQCKCHQRAVADIQRRVRPYVFTVAPGQGVVKPPVRLDQRTLPMPAKVAALSYELMDQLFAELPSGAGLEALSQSAVAGKLRQLAGGAVFYGVADENGDPTGDIRWEEVHEAKLDALDDLLDELQGEPVIVFYWYKHEAVRIKRRLAGRRWVDFGRDVRAAGEAWNRREVEVMLMHPQSAGFGLNLQYGGSHVIWFSVPPSGEQWTQGNGRLARPGQRAQWVTATQLLCGPMDAYVASRLAAKVTQEREFVDGL